MLPLCATTPLMPIRPLVMPDRYEGRLASSHACYICPVTKKMFAQLCATVALAALTLLIGRNMHDLGTVIVFAVGVLATILSAFRVRSIRGRELAARRAREGVVPQNAAIGGREDRSGSIR